MQSLPHLPIPYSFPLNDRKPAAVVLMTNSREKATENDTNYSCSKSLSHRKWWYFYIYFLHKMGEERFISAIVMAIFLHKCWNEEGTLHFEIATLSKHHLKDFFLVSGFHFQHRHVLYVHICLYVHISLMLIFFLLKRK